MIDGVNIPTFLFDNFTPENIKCPIISYKVMRDTEENLYDDLILI